MGNNFDSANRKVQDVMSLYKQMDALENRDQWYFEPKYQGNDSCAFVFSHKTTDAYQRYNDLNALANVLSGAGINCSLIARDGLISDIIIAPNSTEYARKIFVKYQKNERSATKNMEQGLLHKTRENQL